MNNINICYLCFSDRTGLVGWNIDFDTNIYVCNDCGLIQNDFVSGPYLNDYYHGRYRQVRKEAISERYLKLMSLRAESQHDFIFKNLPKSVKIDSALEIGAGAGKLLEALKPTVNLFAVESDPMMVTHMQKSGGITVVDESILLEDENQGKFDLVLLSHVFEHINNPLEYLYRLHKILSDIGYVFIEVPNEPIHLVSHNVKKKQKGIGHLFDYTIDTLRQMIDASHLFDVVALTTYSASINDYIKGATIWNFEENKCGDGIHIRCLLRKREFISRGEEYKYVDAVLQSRYRRQMLNERRIQAALRGIEMARESIIKIMGMYDK